MHETGAAQLEDGCKRRAICIVDDDELLLKSLCEFLRSEGLECLGFLSVESFLEEWGRVRLPDLHIALVVTDWEFSGQVLQGGDLIAALRSVSVQSTARLEVPVLIHSGYVPVDLSSHGIDLRQVAQIRKGGPPLALLSQIRQVMPVMVRSDG